MHIAFGEHFIELNCWERREQMIRYLQDCPAGNILLGEEAEMPREFYTATLHLGAEGHRFGIGICSEGHGLVPQMLLLEEKGTLLFGFNRQVVAFDVAKRQVLFRIELSALFYRFVHLSDKKVILVLYEIGIMALDQGGQKLWQYERDIVSNYRIMGNRAVVEFMDSPSVVIDLITGSVLLAS